MGDVTPAQPVKLFCGIIAVDEAAIARACGELEALYGRIDRESEIIPFAFTDYYREEMGDRLLRKFASFEALIDPGRIAAIKIRAQAIEEQLAKRRDGAPRRRVNLDPGYVAPEKLVLATTKNFAHRIYLGQGVYAEITLNFRKNGCVFLPWTYPDYRSEAYTRFFLAIRRLLLNQLDNRRKGNHGTRDGKNQRVSVRNRLASRSGCA
ncbi:MAG: DUF4416 family protein [Verrucomicrobiota bacterium]|nr:DUF4416 family protein [Verrucomicrobiota bacterium]